MTRPKELPVYQVSFFDFFLYSYFLINCLVYIFKLLLYLISHLIYSLIIFLVNILLVFIYLIKLVVDFF